MPRLRLALDGPDSDIPPALESGGGVPPRLRTLESRRRVLEIYQDAFRERVDDLASQMRSGAISVSEWEEAMRAELKHLHVNATIISHGGEPGLVPASAWGRCGGYLRSQYRYLHNYAQAVQDRAMHALAGQTNFYSEGYLQYRSRLYGGASLATFYQQLAQGLLPQVPGDGQTACKTNCKCVLRFEEGDKPGLVYVFWELRPAEHCEDCIALSQEWAPYELWLPVGMAVEWTTWVRQVGPIHVHHHAEGCQC